MNEFKKSQTQLFNHLETRQTNNVRDALLQNLARMDNQLNQTQSSMEDKLSKDQKTF